MTLLVQFLKLIKENWAIIRQNTFSTIGCFVLLFFILLAVVGPCLIQIDPQQIHYFSSGQVKRLEHPSRIHWFGTTNLGRDVLSQTIHGSRGALIVGVLTAFFITFIGTNIALISGYYKGHVDNILMRLADIAYALPFEPFAIIFVSLVSPSIKNIILAMILLMWRAPARVIRAQVLSLSERPFVKSAKVAGASNFRVIYLHIAPNILSLAFVYFVIQTGWAIVMEASISFLGFGDPNMISWGQMLNMAYITGSIREAWWWAIPPGAAISLLVLSIFLISRAYEEVLNPKLRSR